MQFVLFSDFWMRAVAGARDASAGSVGEQEVAERRDSSTTPA